jgi:hypothetical protein
MNFVVMTGTTGHGTLTGNEGLPTFIVGPGTPAAPVNARNFVFGPNTLSESASNDFNVSVLDDPQSYAALMTPVDIGTIAFFFQEQLSRPLLLPLFVNQMRVIPDGGATAYQFNSNWRVPEPATLSTAERGVRHMTLPVCSDSAALMSPRTAKYVEATIREGDNFDYDAWLKRVRDEEAQAKQTAATGTSGELSSSITSDDQHPRPNSALPLTAKIILALHRSQRQAKSNTPKARLRRWLERVRRAWSEFQASRRRDSVYAYLAAVFAVVAHHKLRRRIKTLRRLAFEFANIPFDKNADPFIAVIRCTCGDGADNKTISKWSRALRYVARRKQPTTRVKAFMKEAGGVNACADRHARVMRNRQGSSKATGHRRS